MVGFEAPKNGGFLGEKCAGWWRREQGNVVEEEQIWGTVLDLFIRKRWWIYRLGNAIGINMQLKVGKDTSMEYGMKLG